MSKELVVVLGMHRSGTSVLTKGIAELGYLVDETMEATEDNAKGYFENKDLVGLNDEILDELKLEWSTCDLIILNRCQTFLPIIIEKYEKRAIELLENLFLKSEKCVVKDPRISILMPFWEYIFNKINIKYNYVLALRNPLEVSNSFVSRKNGSIDEGLKVWTYYNALILKNLFKQTLVVNYKDLLNETSRVMNDLCEFLSIDRERYNLNIEKFINEFVEKGLNHHNKEVESGENVVNDLYSFLNKKYLDNFDNKKYIEVNEEFIDKYLGFDYGNCSGQYSQIYVDDGSGFSENNSFKSKLNGDHKQNLNISFDKFEDVKNLRIDPTDRECVFILESFVNEETNENIIINMSNAMFVNEKFYFLPKDGQIYLNNISEKINSLSIKFKCLFLDKISLAICTSLINENKLSAEMNIKNEIITNSKNIISEKEKIIFEKENIISEKESIINNIVNESNLLKSKCNKLEKEIKIKNEIVNDLNENILRNREVTAMNLSILLNVNRRRERNKYIILYPLRAIKKGLGFLKHPKATIKFNSDLKFIKKINLIDKNYYINRTSDYRLHVLNCIEHFYRYGRFLNLKPNKYFDQNNLDSIYLEQFYLYKDIYKTISKSEFFDYTYYKNNNQDIPKGTNLVWHFIINGWREGRNPSEIFNVNHYLEMYPDIKELNINPLYHFIQHGLYEGRACSEGFQKTGVFYKIKAKKYKLNNSSYDLSVSNVMRYIRKNGLKSSISKAKNLLSDNGLPISVYNYKAPEFTDRIKNEIDNFKLKPKVSIIMPVYNVDAKWLDLAIKSVEKQWYTNWEICIVDDCSTKKETIDYLKNINSDKISIKFSEKNQNISGASNDALKMCTGEYIGLMDNDDEITVDALYEMIKKVNEGYTFIYSDEDKLSMDGEFCEPHFKPDFSRDMLNSQNYMSHFMIGKKQHFDNVDGFTVGLEGAQDFDLYLKMFDMCDVKVAHIPKVLYHWRKIPGSTASEFSEKSYAMEAGRVALENHTKRKGISAKVYNAEHPGTYRIDYDVIGEPLVSIIIPFKDGKNLLTTCVESIIQKSTYKNFEIIGISNNSQLEETFEEMKRLKLLDKRVKFFEYNVPFNYSDINNYAVKEHCKGEYLVLLNNDIEIITESWIELMLGFAQRPNTGAVGAKLYYHNNTIQHAGVAIGLIGLAGHVFKGFSRNDPGYFCRAKVIQNYSAVTAACLMVNKRKFEQIDGLNTENLKIAFNDIDFCLRLQEEGYVNVFTPYVEAYHYESISRGAEDTPEKMARFKSEVDYMLDRHRTILENGDPYYNCNLTLSSENFGLK